MKPVTSIVILSALLGIGAALPNKPALDEGLIVGSDTGFAAPALAVIARADTTDADTTNDDS